MEFTKVVAERYSCKNFSTRKVEAEKLTEILEAGRLAPTAKNSQEQRIYGGQNIGKAVKFLLPALSAGVVAHERGEQSELEPAER